MVGFGYPPHCLPLPCQVRELIYSSSEMPLFISPASCFPYLGGVVSQLGLPPSTLNHTPCIMKKFLKVHGMHIPFFLTSTDHSALSQIPA